MDIIVLDSPPIGALTDAAVLANKVDGVVLVVEMGKTRFADLQHAKEHLERSGAHILGVVLNKTPLQRSSYYYCQYSSYYYNSRHEEDSNLNPGLLKQPFAYMQVFFKKQLNRGSSKEKAKRSSSWV